MKASKNIIPRRITIACPAWMLTRWLSATPPAPETAPTMAPPQNKLLVLSVNSSMMADGATRRETESTLPTA